MGVAGVSALVSHVPVGRARLARYVISHSNTCDHNSSGEHSLSTEGKQDRVQAKQKKKKQQACLGNTMIEKLNYGLNVHFIVAQKKINKLKNHKAIAYKINMCI